MGQKTHPYGFRLVSIRTWRSRWYSEKEYASQLQEDLRIRGFVKTRLNHAGVSSIEIERRSNRVNVLIATARPGIVIGKKGAEPMSRITRTGRRASANRWTSESVKCTSLL